MTLGEHSEQRATPKFNYQQDCKFTSCILLIRQRIQDTFDWISFVPTWTTLAADWAADAATRERRPNP
jgi:hypothetical protein